jgi:hypothetical protein
VRDAVYNVPELARLVSHEGGKKHNAFKHALFRGTCLKVATINH